MPLAEQWLRGFVWLSPAGFEKGVWVFTLFQGYDWVTVLVVANLAFSGLLVSWVMKFADSILKVRICLTPASVVLVFLISSRLKKRGHAKED